MNDRKIKPHDGPARCSNYYMDMDYKIWTLFTDLIWNSKPIMIKDNKIFYIHKDVEMHITWFYVPENHTFEKYKIKNPFEEYKSNNIFWDLCWEIKKPDRTGNIYCVINTPYKQFRVQSFNFDEQYMFKKRIAELYYDFEYNYLNQFIDE